MGRLGRGFQGAYPVPMPEAVLTLPERVLSRLDEMCKEHDRISTKLEQPEVLVDHRKVRELSIQKAALTPVVESYRGLRKATSEVEELRRAIASNADPDFAARAGEELPGLESRAVDLLNKVKSSLVTTDDRKVGSVMLEIRAGTGGDEAALWARDLFEMY